MFAPRLRRLIRWLSILLVTAIVALERAQPQTLRLQLQPHTLYNTLNGAVTLVRRGDKENATKLLTKLADHLRSSLDDKPELTSPLASEH